LVQPSHSRSLGRIRTAGRTSLTRIEGLACVSASDALRPGAAVGVEGGGDHLHAEARRGVCIPALATHVMVNPWRSATLATSAGARRRRRRRRGHSAARSPAGCWVLPGRCRTTLSAYAPEDAATDRTSSLTRRPDMPVFPNRQSDGLHGRSRQTAIAWTRSLEVQ
jgi:hypothetical protein